MDKAAVFGIGQRLGEGVASRLGMNPAAQKSMGEFGRMAVPMVAGSYLQRSEDPMLSGLGTALTYAPMFMGMMPKNLWGPQTPVGKPKPAGPPASKPQAGSMAKQPPKSMKATGVKVVKPRTPQGLVPKSMVKMPRIRMGRFG